MLESPHAAAICEGLRRCTCTAGIRGCRIICGDDNSASINGLPGFHLLTRRKQIVGELRAATSYQKYKWRSGVGGERIFRGVSTNRTGVTIDDPIVPTRADLVDWVIGQHE